MWVDFTKKISSTPPCQHNLSSWDEREVEDNMKDSSASNAPSQTNIVFFRLGFVWVFEGGRERESFAGLEIYRKIGKKFLFFERTIF